MHEHNKTLVMRSAYGKLTGFVLGLLGMHTIIFVLPSLGWAGLSVLERCSI